MLRKLTQVGNSLGVVIPTKILERQGLTKGDSLEITETEDGIALRPAPKVSEDFRKKTEFFMKRYSRTMKGLAQ